MAEIESPVPSDPNVARGADACLSARAVELTVAVRHDDDLSQVVEDGRVGPCYEAILKLGPFLHCKQFKDTALPFDVIRQVTE